MEKTINTRWRFGNSIIWTVALTILLYVFLASLGQLMLEKLLLNLADWSPSMHFVISMYTAVLGALLTLLLILLIVRKNHFILRSFGPAGSGQNYKIRVVEDNYVASNNNTAKMFLIGILLGFVTNFTCILCAIVHGDIKLYFDFSVSQLPVLLFALVSVCIQSTSEELWCRGFMYERINIHYPLWVSVVVNGVFFGLLHCGNPGVSVMAIVGIVVCGLSYSLVRWYTGSIWCAMGIHTMWNFTQNFLFGLPNSGLVSEMSVFHLGAANGINNLIYDYGFGVEAAVPALVVDAALGLAVLVLAKRNGRLAELTMSHEKRAALTYAAQPETPDREIVEI